MRCGQGVRGGGRRTAHRTHTRTHARTRSCTRRAGAAAAPTSPSGPGPHRLSHGSRRCPPAPGHRSRFRTLLILAL